MQVAHGVDLEDVREHGHHEKVRDQANRVLLEISKEVKRTHDHGQDVHHEHDDASDTQ